MSDLVINVRQISNYPTKTQSDGTETLLLQTGGLGGPYQSISSADLVSSALTAGPALGVGEAAPANANGGQIFTGSIVFPEPGGGPLYNLYFDDTARLRYVNAGIGGTFAVDNDTLAWQLAPAGQAGAQAGSLQTMFEINPAGSAALPFGTLTVARDPASPNEVATLNYVTNSIAASQTAMQAYFFTSITQALSAWPMVNHWNGRNGDVWLNLSDITCVFFQPGQQPISPTPAATSNDNSIATTAFVQSHPASLTATAPPLNPASGQLWWNATDGNLYVWYDDGTSQQWVSAFADAGGSGAFLPLIGGTLITPTSAPNQVIFKLPDPGAANVPQGSMLNSYLVTQTTGGSFSDMYCNIRADTTIQGAGNTGITGILSQMTYNGYGGSAGLVPVYGQMSRRTVNAGGSAQNPQIWGAVFEVIDWTNTDSAQTNFMSGIELDMTCGNTDSASNRRAFGIYLNTANSTDTPPVLGMGVHIAANTGSYDTALKVETTFNIAAFDLRSAVAFSANAHAIWLRTGGNIALDTPASLELVGDGTGNMILAGAASQPSRITYQPNGNVGHNYWSGAWNDNNFYIADATTSTNRVTITPVGAITLNGPTTLNAGVTFAPNVGASNTDFTKHIMLYDNGAGAADFGIGITAGRLNIQAGGTATLGLMVNGGDRLTVTSTGMGFNGTAAVAKPTITGSKGGNAALASLMTALAAYGLVTDSTT